MEIVEKKYHFHSAHRNTELEEDKCWSIHGHTYHIEVVINNPTLPGKSTGLLFSEIDEKISPIIKVLDHAFIIYKEDILYDILMPLGMRMYPMDCETSAENLAGHIYLLIRNTGLDVIEVRLAETTSSKVIYRAT